MNRNNYHIIFIFFCIIMHLGEELAKAISTELASIQGRDDVMLAPNAIGIPLGRILLIRRGNEYGAVKFIHCGTTKTDYEQYAEYQSYYQGDQTGDLTNEMVQYRKEEVYYTKPSFTIFGHPIRIGAKRDIRCGPIELWWSSGRYCHRLAVYFNRHDQEQGDYYGIELAPTPWTDVSQVNVFDPRIKWYRYNEERRDQFIPIDKLWPEAEAPVQPGPTKP